MGEMDMGRQCLVWPSDIPAMGERGASTYSLHFATPLHGGQVFGVRYPCDVVIEVFRRHTPYTAGQKSWKFFVQKVDGNI